MDKINDRDREFALEFSRFVNDGMCSAHRTGAELANDHRYLVNEKFEVVMGFIEQLAKDFKQGHYDPRDEWACKLASAAIESLELQRLHSCSND